MFGRTLALLGGSAMCCIKVDTALLGGGYVTRCRLKLCSSKEMFGG